MSTQVLKRNGEARAMFCAIQMLHLVQEGVLVGDLRGEVVAGVNCVAMGLSGAVKCLLDQVRGGGVML